MNIAALYDIHGNYPALKAVLDALESIKPDWIVIGGEKRRLFFSILAGTGYFSVW